VVIADSGRLTRSDEPRRRRPVRSPEEGKKVPFDFVLDGLADLGPWTRPRYRAKCERQGVTIESRTVDKDGNVVLLCSKK
jgi:hypothetical protein